MTEQQYTCPVCHKDYTRFTIHEHYGCGVEPLEVLEAQESPVEAGSIEVTGLPTETIEPVAYGEPTETEPTVETTQPLETVETAQITNETTKPEPKKRGRPAKAK
jgi:hypothetical protein